MTERPLIIFPHASKAKKETRNPFPPSRPITPSVQRQFERLNPKFVRLEQAFEEHRAILQTNLAGALPEQAVVFETVDTIDNFINAVKKIEGLDWLAEWEREIMPDEDFYFEEEGERRLDKQIGGRLFLIMSDQQAMRELKSLWRMYQNQESFPHGKKKWRNLFSLLKDVRPWSVNDRFENTGFLEEWNERVAAGQEIIKFEIELWFRSNEEKRRISSQNIRTLIEQAQGRIITEAIIPDIAYHAILVETPINVFRDISESTDVQFIRSENVMFFRPVGQAMMIIPQEEPSVEDLSDRIQPIEERLLDPIVALFDGMPLENHHLLRNRLIVDDVDNFASQYSRTHERVHGTAMASLIIHGELDEKNKPLDRPIYVRPIMVPDERDWRDIRVECVPLNELPIDIIHRSVRRLFETVNGQPPMAPTVRIINLSIGDSSRPFDFSVSPWAKLLDWLSYKYKVLFIVSAGNFTDGITLDVPRDSLEDLSPEQLSNHIIKSIYSNAHNRRLLTPSESINSITVGSLHDDSSQVVALGNRKELLNIRPMVSPATRIGLGYRRSIKPDIVLNGGRQLYMDDPFGRDHFIISPSTLPPGQKVAHPGKQGDLNSTIYMRGTSNATALATRSASLIYEKIDELRRTQVGGELVTDELITVVIKALLVHGASWGNLFQSLQRILGDENNRLRDRIIPRLIGYGSIDLTRVLECNAQRVTLFGCNYLSRDEAHVYSIPLPPSLSSKAVWRKLTVTLAWFSPINAKSQKYRQAHLWFDPPKDELGINRLEADGNSVRRGTVQHEILVGEQATPFIDGDILEIKVNCRQDAGGLNSAVPYGIALSLEVAEGLDIQIYDEVRDRIRQAVPIRSNPEL